MQIGDEMRRGAFLGVSIGVILLLSGCAQKLDIRVLEPAEIDRVAYTKKIMVSDFSNDRVGLSRKIEANLAGVRIDNQNYFTLISRNDFEKIIKEQRLQSSGLVEQKTVARVGELIGAQAIISGNVSSPSSQDSSFYETRARCADKKCKSLSYYKVRCVNRAVGLSAEVRIVDVEKGDVIFADRLSKNRVYKHCSDYSSALPSRDMAAQRLSSEMADEFTSRLSPHYRVFSVVLLDEPDLDYSKRQEELLDVSLEYIEHGRYDRAEEFLSQLIETTGSQSYVAFYNLGVVKEAQAKYAEAKEYYEMADSLMIKPVTPINEAVLRIDKLIEKHKRTQSQLAR